MILQPPSALLCGPAGSGKTSAIATQLLCGLEVFVVITEPDGTASLLDAAERLRAPIDKLHWSYCPPASAGWDSLETMITSISSMTQQQLADQKNMGKESFRAPALKFLQAFSNFHCDRTGKDYGDVSTWDDTRSLNIDSLTGWSLIGFGCTVGYKPTANPGEWGIAQSFIYSMLKKIITDRRCYFNLTSHIEKEQDELTGIKKIMVSTIGAKLAPKIPPLFSEVIRCTRTVKDGKADFSWSTLSDDMDLKNRALPMKTYLKPDFGPIVEAYERRKKLAAETSAVVHDATPEPPPPVLPAGVMRPNRA